MTSLTYRDAGVHVDAGDDLVERIKPLAKRTMRPEVMGGIGGFGALFQLSGKYREPVLVSGTDGVGTKLKLAFQWNRQINKINKAEVDSDGNLVPESYSEKNAVCEITFTERELNGLLAKNTDLAQKLAIDLANNLVSAKLLIPLEEDFPVLGGKTLLLNAGIGMAYENEKPVIILKGISVMGVPVPNAWLGGIKNIDLVSEFGVDPGFWKSFSQGVDHIQVTDGEINIKLKE